MAAADPSYAKANEFYESVFGTGRPHRDKVLGELTQHRALTRKTNEAWKKTRELQDKVNALPAGSPERLALEKELAQARIAASKHQKQWDADKPARDANNAAYKNLPEEKDAYDVEAEYEAMLQSKREAEAAAKRAGSDEIELDESDFIDDTEIELDESDLVEVTTP